MRRALAHYTCALRPHHPPRQPQSSTSGAASRFDNRGRRRPGLRNRRLNFRPVSWFLLEDKTTTSLYDLPEIWRLYDIVWKVAQFEVLFVPDGRDPDLLLGRILSDSQHSREYKCKWAWANESVWWRNCLHIYTARACPRSVHLSMLKLLCLKYHTFHLYPAIFIFTSLCAVFTSFYSRYNTMKCDNSLSL